MKKLRFTSFFLLHFSYLILSACSCINSLAPFDQRQAAILLKRNYDAKPTQQMIHLTLPQGEQWKKIDMSQNTIGTPLMLIPYNEKATQWKESIRTKISGYRFTPDMTAKQFALNEIRDAKKNCRYVHAHLLNQTPHDVIYELNIANCYEEKDQYQINKVFNGIDAVYVVYYSAITGEITQTQIDKMSNVIKNVQLVKRH